MTLAHPKHTINESQIILLDFDGPIAGLFHNVHIVNEVEALRVTHIPHAEILPDYDHLELIRQAHSTGETNVWSAMEADVVAFEIRAAQCAPMTNHFEAFLASLDGKQIAVVTNNAPEAVVAFSEANGGILAGVPVFGRLEGQPGLLKPHPSALHRAIEHYNGTAEQSVLVGDSGTDVIVANLIGAKSVAYALTDETVGSLTSLNPTSLIRSLHEMI